MKLRQMLLLALALGIVPGCTPARGQQQQQSQRPIKVGLKVEAQGPQGLWMQSGKDLSPAELNQLRSLIAQELGKLSNHKLVSTDEKDDYLALLVVAEKLQCSREAYFLLSSALTIATTEGTDLLYTHDVIAVPDLALAAKAVVGQLVSAELRRKMGLQP